MMPGFFEACGECSGRECTDRHGNALAVCMSARDTLCGHGPAPISQYPHHTVPTGATPDPFDFYQSTTRCTEDAVLAPGSDTSDTKWNVQAEDVWNTPIRDTSIMVCVCGYTFTLEENFCRRCGTRKEARPNDIAGKDRADSHVLPQALTESMRTEVRMASPGSPQASSQKVLAQESKLTSRPDEADWVPKVPCCCFLEPEHRTDEVELLAKGFLCLFCCCSGCGYRSPLHSMCNSNCVCCTQLCEVAHCSHREEGVLGCVSSCICCHSVFTWPPPNTSASCIWCNEVCGRLHKKRASLGEERNVCAYDSMHETFMLAYCCCTGCSVSSPREAASFCKCLGCRCQSKMELQSAEKGCCSHHSACHCLFLFCKLPPKWINNPMCAICGCKCKKPKPHVGVGMGSAPKQQEML